MGWDSYMGFVYGIRGGAFRSFQSTDSGQWAGQAESTLCMDGGRGGSRR